MGIDTRRQWDAAGCSLLRCIPSPCIWCLSRHRKQYRVLWQVCSLVQPSISWFLRGLRRRIILLSSIDKSTTMCPCARVTVAIPKVTSNARKLKHASHTGGLSRSWSATGTHSSTLYLSKGCVWTDSCLYKSITNPCRPEGALVCCFWLVADGIIQPACG